MTFKNRTKTQENELANQLANELVDGYQKPSMTMTTFRITTTQLKKLKAKAESKGQTMAAYIRILIERDLGE